MPDFLKNPDFNHQEGNLKVQLLIKSGYYVGPNASAQRYLQLPLRHAEYPIAMMGLYLHSGSITLEISLYCTEYGCLMKPFFIEIQNFWVWADKLGR